MRRSIKKKLPAPKSACVSEETSKESGKNLTLLSPEMSGWVRVQEWPELFILYRRGSEKLAELQPELATIEERLMSGHCAQDSASAKLGRAFGLLAFLEFARNDPSTNHESKGFLEIGRKAVGLLTETLGGLAGKLVFSSKEAAENSYMDMVALVKRTGEGIVKRRFDPMRYKGKWSLPVLAIWHAKMLCEYHGRLPSKAEVRERLIMIDMDFSKKSKATKSNWNQVFDRAGLRNLPDTPL